MSDTETVQMPDDANEETMEEEAREVPGVPDTFNPVRLVEAALFTAGRPVGIDELIDATGLDGKEVKRAVKALEMEYAERDDACALEVGQAGDKWAMQLKTRYVAHARKLASMEIPKKVLKTLALIAFHQPVLQSEIVDMVGSKAYDHIREIHEAGLVRLKPDGLSKRLTTSPLFPEYFGIPATDTDKIRTYLATKVGLELKKTRDGETVLGDYGENTEDLSEDEAPVEAEPTPEGDEENETLLGTEATSGTVEGDA
ncbi:MAG: SMC-Scp complex subunit ScpB [Euryarchaeota archaeon]|nr:SMC-Scp complex subunit ScpB [Euryarchaeota archaeon]